METSFSRVQTLRDARGPGSSSQWTAVTIQVLGLIGLGLHVYFTYGLLKASQNPVVVNISSALGSFWANHEPSRPASKVSAIVYGASKAAVSMLTVQYARAVPEVKFNAVEPGYTATELGGVQNSGGRPVEVSARNIVRMATIGKDGPTGTFQEDDGELRW